MMRRELTEGKSYGTRETFSDEKALLMNTLSKLVGDLKGNLDQKLIDDSIAAYDDLKGNFRDALMGTLDSYQKGEISAEEMKKMIQKQIREAWGEAYKLGVGWPAIRLGFSMRMRPGSKVPGRRVRLPG